VRRRDDGPDADDEGDDVEGRDDRPDWFLNVTDGCAGYRTAGAHRQQAELTLVHSRAWPSVMTTPTKARTEPGSDSARCLSTPVKVREPEAIEASRKRWRLCGALHTVHGGMELGMLAGHW